jgi:DNA-binding GntR family transcriptional regulator
MNNKSLDNDEHPVYNGRRQTVESIVSTTLYHSFHAVSRSKMDNTADLQETSLRSLSYTSLRDAAYEAIRDAIVEQRIKAGQRLFETELAEKLGISRAPIREALRELEREGLVQSIPHRGTYVTSLSPQDAREIYSLRAAIEGLAITLAVRSGSKELVSDLERCIADMERSAKDGQLGVMVQADFSFHETLCRAADHKRLLDVWLGMRGQIRAFVSVTAMQYLSPTEIVESHGLVLDAVRKGDPLLASEILADDILQVGEYVAAGLEQAERRGTTGSDGGN